MKIHCCNSILQYLCEKGCVLTQGVNCFLTIGLFLTLVCTHAGPYRDMQTHRWMYNLRLIELSKIRTKESLQ